MKDKQVNSSHPDKKKSDGMSGFFFYSEIVIFVENSTLP